MTKKSDAGQSPREKLIEEVYSTKHVTLERCGKTVQVGELPTGCYPDFTRLLGVYSVSLVSALGVAPDVAAKGEAGLRAAGVTDASMLTAMVDALMASQDAFLGLAKLTVTGMTAEEIGRLHPADKIQLIDECLSMIKVSDVQRFFRLTTRVAAMAGTASPTTGT